MDVMYTRTLLGVSAYSMWDGDDLLQIETRTK